MPVISPENYHMSDDLEKREIMPQQDFDLTVPSSVTEKIKAIFTHTQGIDGPKYFHQRGSGGAWLTEPRVNNEELIKIILSVVNDISDDYLGHLYHIVSFYRADYQKGISIPFPLMDKNNANCGPIVWIVLDFDLREEQQANVIKEILSVAIPNVHSNGGVLIIAAASGHNCIHDAITKMYSNDPELQKLTRRIEQLMLHHKPAEKLSFLLKNRKKSEATEAARREGLNTINSLLHPRDSKALSLSQIVRNIFRYELPGLDFKSDSFGRLMAVFKQGHIISQDGIDRLIAALKYYKLTCGRVSLENMFANIEEFYDAFQGQSSFIAMAKQVLDLTSRFVIFHGPAGIGKTTIVHAIAKKLVTASASYGGFDDVNYITPHDMNTASNAKFNFFSGPIIRILDDFNGSLPTYERYLTELLKFVIQDDNHEGVIMITTNLTPDDIRGVLFRVFCSIAGTDFIKMQTLRSLFRMPGDPGPVPVFNTIPLLMCDDIADASKEAIDTFNGIVKTAPVRIYSDSDDDCDESEASCASPSFR